MNIYQNKSNNNEYNIFEQTDNFRYKLWENIRKCLPKQKCQLYYRHNIKFICALSHYRNSEKSKKSLR